MHRVLPSVRMIGQPRWVHLLPAMVCPFGYDEGPRIAPRPLPADTSWTLVESIALVVVVVLGDSVCGSTDAGEHFIDHIDGVPAVHSHVV